MAGVTVTAFVYDDTLDSITLSVDVSAINPDWPAAIAVQPGALGNRMALEQLADPAAALDAIILEQARAAGGANVTISWDGSAASDRDTELAALADAIAEAQQFFTISE